MKGGQRSNARPGRGRRRHISVRAVDRDEVDVEKLGRALVALLRAEAEAQARRERTSSKEGPDAADEVRRG
jgi:hypothetical protein